MLRSRVIAEIICENLLVKIDKDLVVATVLLHDMGNLCKMSFDEKGISFLEPEDLGRVEEIKES